MLCYAKEHNELLPLSTRIAFAPSNLHLGLVNMPQYSNATSSQHLLRVTPSHTIGYTQCSPLIARHSLLATQCNPPSSSCNQSNRVGSLSPGCWPGSPMGVDLWGALKRLLHVSHQGWRPLAAPATHRGGKDGSTRGTQATVSSSHHNTGQKKPCPLHML